MMEIADAQPRRPAPAWVLFPERRTMSEATKRQMTLGMIVGNRGFFPDHLARSGHQEMRAALESAGIKVVALTEAESKFGAVETRQEARRCADLFKKHLEAIDGIVFSLPNFGAA